MSRICTQLDEGLTAFRERPPTTAAAPTPGSTPPTNKVCQEGLHNCASQLPEYSRFPLIRFSMKPWV